MLEDKDRRTLVRHVEDQEYRNIITTLQCMPAVSMECDMKGTMCINTQVW